MGMANGLPKYVYCGSFTPSSNAKSLTIDTGLVAGSNNSVVVGIITSDLLYGVAGQTGDNTMAIIDYMAQGSSNYNYYQRYIGAKVDGTNDFYTNGTITFVDGTLTISGLYSSFVQGCKYNVVVMVCE